MPSDDHAHDVEDDDRDRWPASTDPDPDRDQDRADADQITADQDQTASDADQTGSESDEAGAYADQASAERDQDAADADQLTADKQEARDSPESNSARDGHQAAREDRAASTAERATSESQRAGTQVERTRTADARAGTASLRDVTAGSRDRAAELRDAAALRREDQLRADTPIQNAELHEALAISQTIRIAAMRDRERAADDRARAATDRTRSAEQLRQSKLDTQRAQLDSLTGAFSRELGLVTLQHEIDRARRSGEPFVLAFVDIDGLKAVNDHEGHAMGDRLIQALVKVLREHLRSYDPVVRVGGDEFLCGFVNTTLKDSAARVQQMRSAVRGADPPGTVTVGLAALELEETLADLIARADEDMYQRKRAGRMPPEHDTGRR